MVHFRDVWKRYRSRRVSVCFIYWRNMAARRVYLQPDSARICSRHQWYINESQREKHVKSLSFVIVRTIIENERGIYMSIKRRLQIHQIILRRSVQLANFRVPRCNHVINLVDDSDILFITPWLIASGSKFTGHSSIAYHNVFRIFSYITDARDHNVSHGHHVLVF